MSGPLAGNNAQASGANTGAEPAAGKESFTRTLRKHGLTLARDKTTILQVNVGYLCNQTCRHCHLDAGPDRGEVMTADTMEQVVSYARKSAFEVVDITGGAPELNPNIVEFIENIAPHASRLMFRSNLTAIGGKRAFDRIAGALTGIKAVIVASVPSLNKSQLEAQRGGGVFDKSVDTLKRLNSIGYGKEGTGLELNLVSNPPGAFLPSPQAQLERKFRVDLNRKWDIVFNNLYTFANVPLGRYRSWLRQTGNYETYMGRLADSFNPCAINGLMCRALVSVSWDGYLYDCDFNLAVDLPSGGTKTHVSSVDGPPPAGSPIAVSNHCYTCSAGAGFT